MEILLVSVIAFAIICGIIYWFDKNKEKLIKKFKIEKKEIMKCPVCFKEYDDLKLKECSHCNSYLEKTTKYIFSQKLKKRIASILFIVIIIVLIIIGVYYGISKYIEEKERQEKYNNDISTCYDLIKNKSDYEEFSDIIKNHKDEENFEGDAYNQLYKAIDERVENIKNGNEDKELINMLSDIKFSTIYDDEDMKNYIDEKYLLAQSYSNLNSANKYIESGSYKEAFDLLQQVISNNKDKNQEIVDIATNKQNEIKDKAFEQIINEAQTQINNQDYSSAQKTLENYKDLGNQTILDMYNNATNEVNRIEAERKAKEAEEERQRKQAEIDAKKDQLTINKNGKKIWKVCMTGNTFRFQATYRGSGNFIVKLLDSNQDLEELIVNEIGDYNVDKTVRVNKGEYYYIETYVSNGSWNGSWWGTYGD